MGSMPEFPQWYFAYGSNMVSDVFTKRRKIQPLESEVAMIESHTLCFDVMGVPYTDPAMGGIRLANIQEIPVYGVAYLLTPDDMRRVIVSEGYVVCLLTLNPRTFGQFVNSRYSQWGNCLQDRCSPGEVATQLNGDTCNNAICEA